MNSTLCFRLCNSNMIHALPKKNTKMNEFVLIDKVVLKELGYRFFNNAIRFIRRNPTEFKQGKSFDDENANYIVEWNGTRVPQKLFVRCNVLDKWMTRKHLQIKRKPAENSFLYFIHEKGDLTQFKIGFTTNLEQRLRELQTGNPRDLVIYKTIINSSKKKEKQMQDYFASYHIKGEWYRITCEMIDAVLLECSTNKTTCTEV